MTTNLDPKPGDRRVWWIPQIPGKSFHVDVKSTDEAMLIMDTLADYDIFQYENHIKPALSNAGGLEVFDKDEFDWIEWYDEEDRTIDDIMRESL